jgi:transcriptional regulator GlxA family with amidase domain
MAPTTSPTFEPHYTVSQLGKLWGVSNATITRMFQDEPGVLSVRMYRRTSWR